MAVGTYIFNVVSRYWLEGHTREWRIIQQKVHADSTCNLIAFAFVFCSQR